MKLLPPASAIPSIIVSTALGIVIINLIKPMLPASVSKYL